MRTYCAILIAALLPLVLSGCLADMLVSTAIGGGLEAKQLQTATKALNYAKDTTADIGVNQAIQAFTAENGRFPASLNELVPEWLPAVPVKPDGSPYGYDPTTGKLSEAPVTPAATPRAPTLTNQQKMAQITEAINKYGMATGYYPTKLGDLVPNYLPVMPLTANGAAFIYDPGTGKLYDPTGTIADKPAYGGGPLAQPPPQQQAGAGRPRPTGTGRGSPVLGETMTGIGISNQLDNMSTAGSSAASSSMRANAHGIGAQHDAQQQKAMDDLGL